MRRALLALSLLLTLPACAFFGFGTADSADRSEELRAQLDELRAKAQAGDIQAQIDYAAYLYAIMAEPSVKPDFGEVDWTALLAEADAMLEQQAALPDEAAAIQALNMRAHLLTVTDRKPEAVAAWEAAHAARRSFKTAIGLMTTAYSTQLGLPDPIGFCEQNRDLPQGDSQIHEYILTCSRLNPTSSMAESVPWASEDELAAFNRVNQQLYAEGQARVAAREAEEEARRQQREQEAAAASAASSSSSSSAAPSGPSVVHVTIKNNCRQTVKLFFGDKPKFGSGTSSSIGSNTQTSHSFRPGDMMWIVDDSGNGISSASVSAGMSRIEITESCSGLTAR